MIKKSRIQILSELFCILSLMLIQGSCNNERDSTKVQSPAVNGAMAYAMLNLDIVNDPDKEWCYPQKSTTVIGVPFMERPVQVTYDGALYTRDAELCFFYGDSLQPVMLRQKTYLRGWIPIIQDKWDNEGIEYGIEMFGSPVAGLDSSNTVLFIRINLKNLNNYKAKVKFAAGSRLTGKDHRYGHPTQSLKLTTHFEKTGNMFFRDGHLLYTFPDSSCFYSKVGKTYTGAYRASEYSINETSITGLSVLEKDLDANDSLQIIYKMPNFPVSRFKETEIEAIKNADFCHYYLKTITFWEDLIEGKTYFIIPEERVENSFKASLVHLMLATRQKENEVKRQGSGVPYDKLYFNDYVDMRRVYDVTGHHDFVDVNVSWILKSQNDDGMFLDPGLTGRREIMASHGQALVSLANHYVYTKDTVYANRVYPAIRKAVEWMCQRHNEDPKGLMPPSVPFDAEMIKGYYTSHNLWCLLGLRDAIRVAKELNESGDVQKWTAFHESYKKSVLSAIYTSSGKESGHGGYVPTGLYDFITGPASREGFLEHQTNQDWENNLLIYPTEVLERKDYRIRATLDTIRKNKYREGIMTYRNGMHLHQYVTVNQAHQYLAINNQKQALQDLYHILLHNGSTHEGFENLVEPWEDMDPWPIPPPHAWASAKTALLIRNMLVREYGGEAGINENDRDLYLFSVISPCWIDPETPISIKEAVTEMGTISAEMSTTEKGAKILIESRFHNPPKSIIIPKPWFANIKSVTSDASTFRNEDDYLVFSPDVSEIGLSWKIVGKTYRRVYQELLINYRQEPGLDWRNRVDAVIIPAGQGFLLPEEKKVRGETLSFELVKEAFIKEYNRRYFDYLKAGKVPLEVLPPSLKN